MANTFTKRIQFHIDAATALPLPKNSSRPFVIVKINDATSTDKERPLRTSTVRCDREHDPSWQQNLTATISPTCQVTFEVMQRSPVWAPSKQLAITEPFPLSTLLEMQGGNTFGTNIQLPLHPSDSKSPTSTSARLSVNIRELSSRETADLAVRLSAERRNSHNSDITPPRVPSPTHVSFATPAALPQ